MSQKKSIESWYVTTGDKDKKNKDTHYLSGVVDGKVYPTTRIQEFLRTPEGIFSIQAGGVEYLLGKPGSPAEMTKMIERWKVKQ